MNSQLKKMVVHLLTFLLLATVTQGHSDVNVDFDNTVSVKANGDQSFVIGGSVYASQAAFIESGHRCGQKEPTFQQQKKFDAIVRKWIAENKMGTTNVEIETYFHIITDGATGDKTDQEISAQLTVLNQGFAKTGYSFVLGGITRTSNSAWYGTIGGDDAPALEMKESLREGTASTLNVYLTELTDNLLGFATFPDWYSESPLLDGVVIGTETIPGGSAAPYNLGKTLTHEVGHWLGLYHTFQGGCKGTDFVSDTPAQGTPTFGCPKKKDTCKSKPGLDAINNYMDYSDDVCLTKISKQQIVRMNALWNAYRNE